MDPLPAAAQEVSRRWPKSVYSPQDITSGSRRMARTNEFSISPLPKNTNFALIPIFYLLSQSSSTCHSKISQTAR
jgi:hypothetical protein